jgi:hypothetical protein
MTTNDDLIAALERRVRAYLERGDSAGILDPAALVEAEALGRGSPSVRAARCRRGRGEPYPRELRERAVRMVAEVRPEYGSEYAAIAAVAKKRDGYGGHVAVDSR